MDEIDQIGWKNLFSVNHDFTEIKLKMYDSVKRQHILNVKLISSVPEFSAEYPCPINFQWHEVLIYLVRYKFYKMIVQHLDEKFFHLL